MVQRLQDIGWKVAPISDRCSTFGFTRYAKIAAKAGLRPVFGCELAVVSALGEKKPNPDYWTFFALDDLKPLHELITLATSNPGKEPSLLYSQALAAKGVIKISGERLMLDRHAKELKRDKNFFFGLSPSVPKGLFSAAKKAGLKFIATGDNYFTKESDLEFYRITLGWRAGTQTYPQWILSDEEWKNAVSWFVEGSVRKQALGTRDRLFAQCTATLKKASLLKPQVKKTLRQMCLEGAKLKAVNLQDPIYQERLDRELTLIAEKKFEDYFFIISDLIQWARQRMAVGPARGSSCGSLVCYLLDITTIDPIPYGLIFERFIDINRSDLPDIDVDFSDTRRSLVFDYAVKKYGIEHVAKLGTVGLFKPRSALKGAGAALKIPPWQIEKALDGLIERSSGDSRAMLQLEDTLKETDNGRKLLAEYPAVAIAARMEGHPNNASQHAAGIVATQDPVSNYVAIDARTKTVMCDKKDSEDLNLLKIDALGLTQLSIFERALELIGKGGEYRYLDSLPLDDKMAFDVLNKGHFAGVFQFTGNALKSLTKQITVEKLDDMISITALARPGPLATGGASTWARRRRGDEKITTLHPMLTELTKDTYGVVIYQETVMRIVRELGKMSWEDTSAIRKAMSGRLGDEFFERYGKKFLTGAQENGIGLDTARAIWEQVNTFGSWCLDGGTRLRLANAGSNLPTNSTIAQLYKTYEKKPSSWIRQQKTKPWLVSLAKDGRGWPQMAARIIKSGKKICWRYKFCDGSTVVCTPEHRFIVNGKWKRIGDALIGDEFTSLVHTPQPFVGSGRGKGHAKGLKWKIGKDGKRTGEGNVSWTNGKSAFKKEFRVKMQGKSCEDCGKIFKRMEVHHNDFSGGNCRPKDLSWLCIGDHKRRHYNRDRRRRWQKGMMQASKALISKTKVGPRQTYDIAMPKDHNFTLANGLVAHNSFNLSHAVAYGIVSYQCCWLKAHHPVAFAAATLDAESDPAKQIALLRELRNEGISYKAVDPDHSIDKWTIAKDAATGSTMLVGPLTAIKGIGPATVKEIMDARHNGSKIRDNILKRMATARTDIDTLFPIEDAVKRMFPKGLPEAGIVTPPTPIANVQCGIDGQVLIIGVVKKVAPKDENEAVNVMKRGGKVLSGPTQSLNLFFQDDTDEVFCKINRFNFEAIGREVMENARVGRSIYAVKGSVPKGFRMISVDRIKYLGEVDDLNLKGDTGARAGAKLQAGEQSDGDTGQE